MGVITELPLRNMSISSTVHNVAIKGIVSCVPKNKVVNSSLTHLFAEEEIISVSKMTGVKERRVAPDRVTTGDLCAKAAARMLNYLGWERDSVDALIVVTQTPDFLFPPTALKIQSDLGLSTSCIAFDVNLGCSGYPYGLYLASSLIDGLEVKRVLLLVGDTISKVVNSEDRATALLFGDAGTATALEYSSDDSEFFSFDLGSDGQGVKDLFVPGSGFNTAFESGLASSGLTHPAGKLFMNGSSVFEFTLKRIPPLVSGLMNRCESVDFYLMHQANRFLLKHLIKKMDLDKNKVPFNIDLFGNTSSASIPLLMTTKFERVNRSDFRACLIGFGVGFSWGAAVISVAKHCYFEALEYDF